jgi:hypothetical protein
MLLDSKQEPNSRNHLLSRWFSKNIKNAGEQAPALKKDKVIT